jgi:hypothetical protein
MQILVKKEILQDAIIWLKCTIEAKVSIRIKVKQKNSMQKLVTWEVAADAAAIEDLAKRVCNKLAWDELKININFYYLFYCNLIY